MSDITARTPWASHMGDLPLHLDYFEGTVFEAVSLVAEKYPEQVALVFMGRSVTYRDLVKNILRCAAALKAMGINEGDRVTVALPNCPQAVYLFYAINLIGAVANMIHPLSAEKEIEFYLNRSKSVAAVTLDAFYGKFNAARRDTPLRTLLITSIKDELSPLVKVGYSLTEGRKVKKIPADSDILQWKDFLRAGRSLGEVIPAEEVAGGYCATVAGMGFVATSDAGDATVIAVTVAL